MGRIKLSGNQLAQAISEELTIYSEQVEDDLIEATREAMVDLVRKTRATAPKRSGTFRRAIAGDFRGLKRGTRNPHAVWYVKAPHHRRAHLLVHGHAKKGGGRVDGDPFLHNALNEVLPAYENAVKEALTK